MVPLQNLAVIKFGFKTGSDKFFCVRDVTQQHLDRTTNPQEFRENWGISREQTRRTRIVRDGDGVDHLVEDRFLEPELHTPMEVKRVVVRRENVDRLVINAPVSRAKLRRTHLGAYVEFAEQNGWHTGSTIESRAPNPPLVRLGTEAQRAEGRHVLAHGTAVPALDPPQRRPASLRTTTCSNFGRKIRTKGTYCGRSSTAP